MTPNQARIFAAAIAVATWGSASSAQAQTIVNLTNLDPSTSGYGAPNSAFVNPSTSLDLLNTTTALSNGGLFAGAVSSQSQTAYNQLNTLGINANGSVSPVILGNQTPVAGTPNIVEINTITSAYNMTGTAAGAGGALATLTGTSSATINNINAAISSAVNPIIGALGTANSPWTGGYGGAAGGAAVTANQVGINTINGVGAAFADGTSVALSQLPGAPTPGAALTGTVSFTASAATAIADLVGKTVTINGVTYTTAYAGSSLAIGQTGVIALTAAPTTYGSTGAPSSTGSVSAETIVPAGTFGTASLAATTVGPIIQGGSLNMSTTNTLLAYATAGTVGINGNNGVDALGAPVRGQQTAVNTFNASTLVGTNLSVGAQQLADGLNGTQTALGSINRALAYSPGSISANIDPSVTNLNQTASVGVNALNLQQSGTAATGATLSGLQSTGYNTVSGGGVVTTGTVGTNAIAAATNQIVASTVTGYGFLANSPNVGTVAADWAATASTLAGGMPVPGSAGYPRVTTGTNSSAFLPTFNPNVTGAANPFTTLNAGDVNIANANQTVNLTNNTVSAGSSAAPVNVTFGSTGFEQRTGAVGIASNTAGGAPASFVDGIGSNIGLTGGLSNAQALTGAGSARISDVAQNFQTANNTFQGSGDVTGSLTQGVSGILFNAANISSGSAVSGVRINGGSGMIGPSGSHNGYTLAPAGIAPNGSALNNAVAGAVFGPVSLTQVRQTATTFANVAAVTGTIDTAASGTLAQSLGTIDGYTGVQNAAVANSVASGNVAVTGTTQSLGMTGNAVQAAAINGSIAQLVLGSSADYGATNAVLASAGNGTNAGQGAARLNTTTQSNISTLNAIQSAGALGSGTVPAALSQQSGDSSNYLGATAFSTSTGGAQVNTAMIAPSNLAVVQATNGAGGSATADGTAQRAGLSVNSLVGGTAAGTGITGNATQVSYGQATSIGNQALAYAANAPRGAIGTLAVANLVATNPAVGSSMLGAQGVMSGNAMLTNQNQLATQSTNTMALAGANNGILNQATFGATNQTSGNQLYAQSNGGYALTSGAQTATNAVNVITAR